MLLNKLTPLSILLFGAHEVFSLEPKQMHFCTKEEQKGQPETYCDTKYQRVNNSINAVIQNLTIPRLDSPPFRTDRLPDTLLPLDTSGLTAHEKQPLEDLCSRAYAIAKGNRALDPSIVAGRERDFEKAKEQYYWQLWCMEAYDKCGADRWATDDGYSLMQHETWNHGELETQLIKYSYQQGMIVLGGRLLDELDKSEEIRKQCLKKKYVPEGQAKVCDGKHKDCKPCDSRPGWDLYGYYTNCKVLPMDIEYINCD